MTKPIIQWTPGDAYSVEFYEDVLQMTEAASSDKTPTKLRWRPKNSGTLVEADFQAKYLTRFGTSQRRLQQGTVAYGWLQGLKDAGFCPDLISVLLEEIDTNGCVHLEWDRD